MIFLTLLALSTSYYALGYHPSLDVRPAGSPRLPADAVVAKDDPYFPSFHPRAHISHNNDVNGPFHYKGVYHLFMQQDLPWALDWNGAIGWGHLVSTDLAHWKEISRYTGFDDALVPGRWTDPEYGIPGGGYYSGSATIVDGVPRLVFPSFFTVGPCFEAWQPNGSSNKCHMDMQMSVPVNLSDPYLAEWTQPVTILPHTAGNQSRLVGANHSYVWEDPAQAWPNPVKPGEWVFIAQTGYHNYTTGDTPVLLQAWSSRSGSNWTDGWDYLGDFFPGTGDSRCSGPTCGYFTPEFSGAHSFNGLHLLYAGDNIYWLGRYEYPKFVPTTLPLPFDGPESSCFKGFYDEHSDRYLIWSWVGVGLDVLMARGWDSMISVAREVQVDAEIMRMTQYPVEEIAFLRTKVAASYSGIMAEGLTQLDGVANNTLDIEVAFNWDMSGGSIPKGAEVGIAVLFGSEERTLISFQTGGTTLNATGNGRVPASNFIFDTTLTRAKNSKPVAGPGSVYTQPMEMKALTTETSLTLRIIVDRSVVEVFAQRGRITSTRRVYPGQAESNGVALFYKAPGGKQIPPPSVDVNVWEMGKGLDIGPQPPPAIVV